MPTEDAQDLIDLTREICAKDLAPQVDEMERAAEFPRDTFRLLGKTGLLSLPYPEEYGGGGPTRSTSRSSRRSRRSG